MRADSSSQFPAGENVAYDAIERNFPLTPSPAAIVAMFCSATPTSKYRAGYFLRTPQPALTRKVGAKRDHVFVSVCGKHNTLAYPSRVGRCSTFSSKKFGI